MSFEIATFPCFLIKKQAVTAIEKCNDWTAVYGLVLSHNDIAELVETRFNALTDNSRIEFGGGVIEEVIKAFYDSPFISKDSYAETLRELIEIFYYYKNETLDLVSDDVLIQFMKKTFNGSCKGSLELLADRELANMAHSLRFGNGPCCSEDCMPEEDSGDIIG